MYTELFKIEDNYMTSKGLYTLWSLLFIINIVILLWVDNQGPERDFNITTSLLSTLYPSLSMVNIIYGNRLPSSMLLMVGPVHQYAFWMLFAYYKPEHIYPKNDIGYMNIINTIIVSIFSLDMLYKTWSVTRNPQAYLHYAKENTPVSTVV
jgi:hypothetical protein